MKVSLQARRSISMNVGATAALPGLVDVFNNISSILATMPTVGGYAAPLAALAKNTGGNIAVAGNRCFLGFVNNAGAAVNFDISFITVTIRMYIGSSVKIDLGRLAGAPDGSSSQALKSSFFNNPPQVALLGSPSQGGIGFQQAPRDSGFSAGPNPSNVQIAFPVANEQASFDSVDGYTYTNTNPLFTQVVKGNVNGIGLEIENTVGGISAAMAALFAAAAPVITPIIFEVIANIDCDVTVPTTPNGSLTPTYALMPYNYTVSTAAIAGYNTPLSATANALGSVLTGTLSAPSGQLAIRISDLDAPTRIQSGTGVINFPATGGVVNPAPIQATSELFVFNAAT